MGTSREWIRTIVTFGIGVLVSSIVFWSHEKKHGTPGTIEAKRMSQKLQRCLASESEQTPEGDHSHKRQAQEELIDDPNPEAAPIVSTPSEHDSSLKNLQDEEESLFPVTKREPPTLQDGKKPDSMSIKRETASAQPTTVGGFISSEADEKSAVSAGSCSRWEYRGDGPGKVQISRHDWKVAVDQFHTAKNLLLNWLRSHKNQFSDQSIRLMERQLTNLKIISPSASDEPDLNWRGIGVWVRDEVGAGFIRASSGFVKLQIRQPKRGLFEMTRLVAQSWSPCELERIGIQNPWKSLLSCLQVQDTQDCAAGSYSDAGWAVSSSLAEVLARPECGLPAFDSKEKQECLAKLREQK